MTIKDRPSGQNIGYVRVSSAGQSTARQLDGVTLDHVFTDKASAATAKRSELEACLRHLRAGDTLHVHSMDRLARNLRDLAEIVDSLTACGVVVRFHKEGLTFQGQDSPMDKLLLGLLGSVAEFERALIRERQAEGIRKAQAKGTRFGRALLLTDKQARKALRWKQSGEPAAKIARVLGVSRSTLYRAFERMEPEKAPARP